MFNPKQPLNQGDIVRVVGDIHKKVVWKEEVAFRADHTATIGEEYELDSIHSSTGKTFLYPIGRKGLGPIKVCGLLDLELVRVKRPKTGGCSAVFL